MASSTDRASQQLEQIQASLKGISERASRIVGEMTKDELLQRTKPATWSMAECIVHLNLTTEAYLPLFDAAIEDARRKQLVATGAYHMDIAGWLLKLIIEPPARFKTHAILRFQPRQVKPVEEVLPTFLRLQGELIKRVEASGGLALGKVMIASPFNERFRYNLYSAFHIHLAHERRHLMQAEHVKLTFPRFKQTSSL